FAMAVASCDYGSMVLAAHAVGAAQRLLEASVAHAKTRTQFGHPIGTNQAIQWLLADGAIEVHAARLMVYDVASRADRGERVTDLASKAKLFATEAIGRIAERAVQTHGAM